MTVALFAEVTRRYDLRELDRDAASIAVVSAPGPIVWVNTGWRAFGAANGAKLAKIAVGVDYLAAISGDLRDWFEALVHGCIASGDPFELDYECSSAVLVRTCRMRLLPVGSDTIESAGFVVVHSLLTETARDDAGAPSDVPTYRDDDGIVVMCSHCRRVRRADRTQWDWVSAWVAKQPDTTSHGICAACAGHYFPP